MKFSLGAAFVIAAMLAAMPAHAQKDKDDDDDKPARRGQAGLLTGVRKLDQPITLSSGKPLVAKPFELQAGKYYRLRIVADGTAELALSGADFFRNVWINEIVINKIEIRPLGVESLEFDDEGEAEISFVTIRPGTFTLRVPGTTGETQQAVFNVK
jgi:hypothetical protein